jgi:hypothetical protein
LIVIAIVILIAVVSIVNLVVVVVVTSIVLAIITIINFVQEIIIIRAWPLDAVVIIDIWTWKVLIWIWG